jgi:hypothetical protein
MSKKAYSDYGVTVTALIGASYSVTYRKSQERNFESAGIRFFTQLHLGETLESVSGVLFYCWIVLL